MAARAAEEALLDATPEGALRLRTDVGALYGSSGPITVRNGHTRMQMYLAGADGLDFKLIKPI